MKHTPQLADLSKLFGKDYEPFKVNSAPLNQCHTVTIDEDFREVQQFAELVNILEHAQQGDVVVIKMSTIGGALHAIIPLMAALKNTEAHTMMHVESDTASAGTILMMLVDEVYVNEYATIMLHNVSYGAGGHGGAVEAQVKHTTMNSKKLMRDVYEDFLSLEEIERMEAGMEIYLTDEDCHERFQKRDEARVARMAAMKEAAQAKAVKKPRPKKVAAKAAAEHVVE